MSEQAITGLIKTLSETLGIQDLNTHDGNYYWATYWAGKVDVVRLQEADGWKQLPQIPEEALAFDDEPVDVQTAAVRASQVAEIAVLRTELSHTQAALEEARQALENAQQRVTQLEDQIAALQASQGAAEAETQAKIHTVQIELERARGEAQTMQARLSAYALTGGKPIPLATIILVTASAAVLLVLVVFLVVRLAG